MHLESMEQATTLLRKIFGLELPVTLSELKSAYRKLVHKIHPDHNNVADGHEFVIVTEAFDALCQFEGLFDPATEPPDDCRDVGNSQEAIWRESFGKDEEEMRKFLEPESDDGLAHIAKLNCGNPSCQLHAFAAWMLKERQRRTLVGQKNTYVAAHSGQALKPPQVQEALVK